MSTSPTPAPSEEVRIEYNEFYNDPDADITLQSSDGVRFKVHSLILRLSSDVFGGMIAMPQGPASDPTEDIVQLSEDGFIVLCLLDSIYPRRPRPKLALRPLSFVSCFAAVADKYDILDVTTRIRELIQKYVLASRHGWSSEARFISQFVRPPDTEDSQQRAVLESMDTASLLNLISLHRRRHNMINQALWIHFGKNAGEHRLRWEFIAKEHAEDCRSQLHDKSAWAKFERLVRTEIN
ncbi:hypothetical protein DFH11DRAFT_1611518 [Phellopilus nigrolimitatus]|nr:hypothetical protein DFH11DRAFT_1611518 [Phellopilus nigrolimitatus]